MKEKLIIKNFGPLKSVNLDLGKITVLIGEQATGKSTVSKVLSICRYFSYIVNYVVDIGEKSEFHLNTYFSKGLENWGLNKYRQTDSYIFYENEDYVFEYKFMDIHLTKIKSKSTKFEELLKESQELKNHEKESFGVSSIEMWYPNELFFRLNVKKVMNNPLFIPTERSLQSTAFSKGLLISDAELDALGKLSRIATKFKETSIEPLSLIYKNENNIGYIKKENEENYYELHNAASGYKAAIPIALAIKYYAEFENRKKTFIVEEPEQNLFPEAQKKLMEFMVESVNKFDNQFILPTHSPYILTPLGNLIYAHKLGTSEKGMFQKEVAKIIPKESWIDVNDISVYYLNNGEAKDLVDVEECLINLDDLDNVSEIINTKFDALLEIDIALEKEIK